MSMNLLSQWTQQWSSHHNIHFHFFQKTTSTNIIAQNLNLLDEKKSLILAEWQTQGRGRKNRQWLNSDFMSSWVWIQKNKEKPSFSIQIGQKVYQSLQNSWPSAPWRFKKPNDIYLEDKKTAGLLIEIFPQKNDFRIVIGLGINVFKTPKNIPARSIAFYESVNQKKWEKFLSLFWSSIQYK